MTFQEGDKRACRV